MDTVVASNSLIERPCQLYCAFALLCICAPKCLHKRWGNCRESLVRALQYGPVLGLHGAWPCTVRWAMH